MDKRSKEKHTRHRLIQIDESHIKNVAAIRRNYRLHTCLDCPWRGWVGPWEEDAA